MHSACQSGLDFVGILSLTRKTLEKAAFCILRILFAVLRELQDNPERLCKSYILRDSLQSAQKFLAKVTMLARDLPNVALGSWGWVVCVDIGTRRGV
jgi:hypothetical protein